MTTPVRPVLNVDVVPAKADAPQPNSRAELPIATELPPWDLVPSDLLLVRRRPVKK